MERSLNPGYACRDCGGLALAAVWQRRAADQRGVEAGNGVHEGGGFGQRVERLVAQSFDIAESLPRAAECRQVQERLVHIGT